MFAKDEVSEITIFGNEEKLPRDRQLQYFSVGDAWRHVLNPIAVKARFAYRDDN